MSGNLDSSGYAARSCLLKHPFQKGNLATGHFVRVKQSAHEMRLTPNVATIQGLSLRLAKPLCGVLPAPDVSVLSCAVTGNEAKYIAIPAEHNEHLLAEARTTGSPGAAALNGTGFRPCDAKPKQE